jgi:hypothetical protein
MCPFYLREEDWLYKLYKKRRIFLKITEVFDPLLIPHTQNENVAEERDKNRSDLEKALWNFFLLHRA